MKVFVACILWTLCLVSEAAFLYDQNCWQDDSFWDGPGCCVGNNAAANKQTMVKNSAECAEKCWNHSNCKLVTYWEVVGQPHMRYCRMHSSSSLAPINILPTLRGASGLNQRAGKTNPYKTAGASRIMSAQKGCFGCWTPGKYYRGPGIPNQGIGNAREIAVCSRAECIQKCRNDARCNLMTYWKELGAGGKQYCRIHSDANLPQVVRSDTTGAVTLMDSPSGVGKIAVSQANTQFYIAKKSECKTHA